MTALGEKYFTPLADFYCEDLESHYCKDMVYTIRQGNEKLAALSAEWCRRGMIRWLEQRPIGQAAGLNAATTVICGRAHVSGEHKWP